jgi:hypothetical protein
LSFLYHITISASQLAIGTPVLIILISNEVYKASSDSLLTSIALSLGVANSDSFKSNSKAST